MTRSELINMLTDDLSPEVAHRAVSVFFNTITRALADDRFVYFYGFGTFMARRHPSRTVRNPATGKKMPDSPASRYVHFRGAAAMNRAIQRSRLDV